MCELNQWRARVGRFNLCKPCRHRTRSSFSKLDIHTTTHLIKQFVLTLFLDTCLNTKQSNHLNFTSLLIQLHPVLYLIINPFTTCTLTPTHTNSHMKQKFLTIHLFSMLLLLLLCGDVHPNPGPCINDSVCHLNARSIAAPHRLDDMENVFVGCHGFDIITASETHLDSTVTEAQVELSGYDFFRLDRTRFGGGVGIYCRTGMAAKRLTAFEIPGLELIWIEFLCASRRNIVGCCYRPPGQNLLAVNSFLLDLEQSIQSVLATNPHSVTILGDFNDRCTVWDSLHTNSELGNKLYNLITNNNLLQLISEPTRQNNLLDLIITNSPTHYFDFGVLQPLTNLDHCTMYAKFQQSYISATNYIRTIWEYDLGNFTTMNAELTNKLNIDPSLDVTQLANNLTQTIHQSMHDNIPHKKILNKPHDKPWFTSTVKNHTTYTGNVIEPSN